MSLGSKMNAKAVGCVFQLIAFVALVVAFVALVFFLFSGLSFFLGGDKIEAPAFSEMWTFLEEWTEEFFDQIDGALSDESSHIIFDDANTSATLWVDALPESVTVLDDGTLSWTNIA